MPDLRMLQYWLSVAVSIAYQVTSRQVEGQKEFRSIDKLNPSDTSQNNFIVNILVLQKVSVCSRCNTR